MTKAKHAYRLREDGKSWKEIAEILGYKGERAADTARMVAQRFRKEKQKPKPIQAKRIEAKHEPPSANVTGGGVPDCPCGSKQKKFKLGRWFCASCGTELFG